MVTNSRIVIDDLHSQKLHGSFIICHKYIEENLKTDITAKELSEMAGFYKAFVREFGYTPTEFGNNYV